MLALKNNNNNKKKNPAYLFMRDTERGRDTGRGRNRLPARSRIRDWGLDPRTPGSPPEPRAAAAPLSLAGAAQKLLPGPAPFLRSRTPLGSARWP